MTSAATSAATWLVGDIGATHARFGLVSPDGTLLHSRTSADEDYPAIDDAIAAFLAERGALPMPRQGAIAIASPITGDRVAMINAPWIFSLSVLKKKYGWTALHAVNPPVPVRQR